MMCVQHRFIGERKRSQTVSRLSLLTLLAHQKVSFDHSMPCAVFLMFSLHHSVCGEALIDILRDAGWHCQCASLVGAPTTGAVRNS